MDLIAVGLTQRSAEKIDVGYFHTAQTTETKVVGIAQHGFSPRIVTFWCDGKAMGRQMRTHTACHVERLVVSDFAHRDVNKKLIYECLGDVNLSGESGGCR